MMSHITVADPTSWLALAAQCFVCSKNMKDPTKHSVAAMLLAGCKQRATLGYGVGEVAPLKSLRNEIKC